MNTLPFVKYQGTGNDFILMDNRAGQIHLSTEQVAALCHRRLGIGADGLMLLEAAAEADFRMRYFNADGRASSMCGNGGRCIVAYARRLGLVQREALFEAIDGLHRAQLEDDGSISLHMSAVTSIRQEEQATVLDTGSPHYILWVDEVARAPVLETGRRIRYEARFAPGGINVNFVQRIAANRIAVRTYERGVEDETLSCGTGVTAAAIAASGQATGSFAFEIDSPGGRLQVRFEKDSPHTARQVVLRGPALFVFEGAASL